MTSATIVSRTARAGLPLVMAMLLSFGALSGAGAQTGTELQGLPGAGSPATGAAIPMDAVPFEAKPDRTQVDPEFRLGPGDVLSIRVFEDSSLDAQVLVPPDGRISFPLAGSVMAAGRTPDELARTIQQQLRSEFVEPPTVTASLLALAPEEVTEEVTEELLTVYVLGEVNNPGGFGVEEPIGVLQALSLAGGPGIFAARKRVQVRQKSEQGVEQVFLVDYEALEDGAAAPGLLLGDGDTVMVPERGLFE